MKNLFSVVMGLLLTVCFCACRQKELPQVEFSGQAYQLVLSAQQAAGRINEYLLPGEDLEHYSKMIAVYSFPGLNEITPQQAVKRLAAAVADNNITPTYEIHNSDQPNAAIIDFLVFGPGATLAEYNIFKYVKDGNEMKALQFVARWYGSNDQTALKTAQEFATQYLENRQQWVKKIDAMPVPPVYTQDYSSASAVSGTALGAQNNKGQPAPSTSAVAK